MNTVQFGQWMLRFIQEVRLELSRIEWPTYNEFIGSTIVVLFLVTILSLFFGAVDRVISVLMQYIFELSL
jgi:preprotein translocase subunit SecE